MENKKFNWKTFGWICLNIFIICVLNATLFYFFFSGIMEVDKWYLGKEPTTIVINGIKETGTPITGLWDSFGVGDWEFWVQWFFIFFGIILSFGWFKLLFKKHISEKQTKKLVEVEDKKEKQLEKLLEKILEGKK